MLNDAQPGSGAAAASAADAENLEAILSRANAVISEALECGLLADAEEAIAHMEASAPEDPRPHHLRGLLSMLRADPAAAEAAFRRALDLPSAPPEARLGLAGALLGRSEPAQAWRVLAPLRAEPPDDPRSRHWLIRAGAAAECWEELAPLLERCLERTPEDAPTRLALAGVYLRLGRRAEARAQHDRLRAEHPGLDGLEQLAGRLEQRGATA